MNDNSKSIVGFTMISHAIVHTYELSIPILVVIWLAEFSVTTALLGIAVAIGYSLFGIGALPSGLLVDRYGAKRLVLVCLAGMGVSFLLLSTARGVITIALSLSLWGIAASIHHPAALALISTGVEERGTGFAYHGMAGNFGIAFGPLVTAILLLIFDWRIVTILLIIPTILAISYALTAEFDETAAVSIEEETSTEENPSSLSSFLASSRALFTIGFSLALVAVMMNGLFYRGTLTFLPDVLSEFLPNITEHIQLFEPGSRLADEFDLASYLYAGLLTVGIGGQYVGGKLTDRIAVPLGLAGNFTILVAISIVFIPAAESGLTLLLIASGLLGFFLFTIQPFYQAAIAEFSPPGNRGLSYGYTYLANFGVGAAGAAIAGYLLVITDVSGTFLTLATVPALGAVLSVILFRLGDSPEE
jgi:MFS family permease